MFLLQQLHNLRGPFHRAHLAARDSITSCGSPLRSTAVDLLHGRGVNQRPIINLSSSHAKCSRLPLCKDRERRQASSGGGGRTCPAAVRASPGAPPGVPHSHPERVGTVQSRCCSLQAFCSETLQPWRSLPPEPALNHLHRSESAGGFRRRARVRQDCLPGEAWRQRKPPHDARRRLCTKPACPPPPFHHHPIKLQPQAETILAA